MGVSENIDIVEKLRRTRVEENLIQKRNASINSQAAVPRPAFQGGDVVPDSSC